LRDTTIGTDALPAHSVRPTLIDLNGDGLKDVVEETGVLKSDGTCDDRAGFDAPAAFRYFLQRPDGTFSGAHSLPRYGTCSAPMIQIDVDGDGIPNLIKHGPQGWAALVVTSETDAHWVTGLPGLGNEEAAKRGL